MSDPNVGRRRVLVILPQGRQNGIVQVEQCACRLFDDDVGDKRRPSPNLVFPILASNQIRFELVLGSLIILNRCGLE